MLALAQWLESTSISHHIQTTLWLIPLLQTIHIIAIAMVLSAVLMVDLRILGLGASQTLAQTSARFVPWLWTGLLLLALTGIPLIVGEPKRALPNPAFQLKMLMLALTIALVLVFQTSLRHVGFWEGGSPARKLTCGLAVAVFALWCAIAVAGRWIAYIPED
jgi:hypothetical protein